MAALCTMGRRRLVVDSAPVRACSEAGAIVVAKTAMPDFGTLASGISSQFGVIGNPWGPQYTRMARAPERPSRWRPASGPWRWVPTSPARYGFRPRTAALAAIKPTQGRIAYTPASVTRSAGPMARSSRRPRDHARVRSAKPTRATPGVCRANSRPPHGAPITFAGSGSAMLTAMGYGLTADAETLAVVAKAGEQLAAWGAEVERASARRHRRGIRCVSISASSSGGWPRADGAPDHHGERLRGIESSSGATRRAVSPAGRDGRRQRRGRGARPCCRAHGAGCDLIVAPVLPVPAFPAGRLRPERPTYLSLYHASFTAWFNQTGQPAASICGGRTAVSGMPIGLQIVGKRFHDAEVLRVAVLLEEAFALELPWPTSSARRTPMSETAVRGRPGPVGSFRMSWLGSRGHRRCRP